MRRRVAVAGALLALLSTIAVAPAAADPPPNLAMVNAQVVPYATGLSEPTAIAWRTGDARMYVAEQTGLIRLVNTNGSLGGNVLNLTSVISHGNEEGVLGIAFSADGTKLYVDYTNADGDIRLAEWTMGVNAAIASSRRLLMLVKHPVNKNHNGGQILFGPDGMLYMSIGDGGGGGDVPGNAQNRGVLLGKILRIDPHPLGSMPYQVPATNPFVHTAGAKPEIWMYGLRNPWRFTFDKATGDMWIGDVGQNLYEEVDFAPAGLKGTNWGWNKREGLHPYNGGAKPAGAREPLFERAHSLGECAVTGGYVYRGSAVANLAGAYVFGDFCRGLLIAVVRSANFVAQARNLQLSVPLLTTFGQAPDGELYPVSRGGTIYKLVPGP